MTEDLFQLLAIGLLAVGVLLLVLIASQLGRIRDALARREADASQAGTPPGAVMAGTQENGSRPAEDHAPILEGDRDDEPSPSETAETRSEVAPEDADASAAAGQPFQREGRWWFERDGELLVFDEQSGEWVPDTIPSGGEPAGAKDEPRPQLDPDPTQVEATPVAPASGSPAPEEPAAEAFTHPLDEPRPQDAPSSSTPEEAPLAAPEEAASFAPEGTPTTAPEGTPATAPEETPATAPEGTPAPATYWKCPSCGVVNGSTASLCRMCFTARP